MSSRAHLTTVRKVCKERRPLTTLEDGSDDVRECKGERARLCARSERAAARARPRQPTSLAPLPGGKEEIRTRKNDRGVVRG